MINSNTSLGEVLDYLDAEFAEDEQELQELFESSKHREALKKAENLVFILNKIIAIESLINE